MSFPHGRQKRGFRPEIQRAYPLLYLCSNRGDHFLQWTIHEVSHEKNRFSKMNRFLKEKRDSYEKAHGD